MLITLVLILLLIWAAVVWSIYSNFLVFYSNFNESENYHKAYYNSIAALERAELVIKQRSPWYVWNGWWILGHKNWEWSVNKWWSDGIISNFSYLSNDAWSENTSTVFRNIDSKAKRIPKAWNGDVEQMFAYTNSSTPTENSSNFNMMDYDDAQIFLLYYDKSEWNPYTRTKCDESAGSCEQSTPKAIKWVIRLPAYLTTNFSFWDLDTSKSLVGNLKKDDAIVDWQIRWKYSDVSLLSSSSFTIYATQTKDKTSTLVTYPEDSTIRESDINDALGDHKLDYEFSKSSKRSPTWDGKDAGLTIISSEENSIKNKLWCNSPSCTSSHKYFEDILTKKENYTDKQLRFSLLNLLETADKKIYPFLEYYVEFQAAEDDDEVEISDKYFNIDAEWNYGDYKINKIVWRPTSKESVLGNFTSIF